jgi:hypothetical protein
MVGAALGGQRDRLQAQPAHKIAFPNPNTLPAQNVVGRRRMEVEVPLREGQEEILGREVEAALAECEAHVAPDEGVDFRIGILTVSNRHQHPHHATPKCLMC